MAEDYVIEMLHITKEFPGIKANDDITLQLRKGEVHALLGENGAGKSTLMSVLFGLYQPEQGKILKNGKEVAIRNPNDANALGIGMVHQHFKLVECFSVLDNIILGVEPNKMGFFAEGRGTQKGDGAERKVRPAGGPGRTDQRYLGGYAAARGDPEDAVPRQRDPDL